jgi:hypothetical protein
MKSAQRALLAVNLGLILLALSLPITLVVQSRPNQDANGLRATLVIVSALVLVGAGLNLWLLRMTTAWPADLVTTFSSCKSSSDASLLNFTPRAQQTLALARREAEKLHHRFVGTEHVLLGLIALRQGIAVNVLLKLHIDMEMLRREIEKQVGTGPDAPGGIIPYTPRVKKVLALAARESESLNHTYVGTEHLFLGLLREGEGVAACVLTELGVDLAQARQAILENLDPGRPFA